MTDIDPIAIEAQLMGGNLVWGYKPDTVTIDRATLAAIRLITNAVETGELSPRSLQIVIETLDHALNGKPTDQLVQQAAEDGLINKCDAENQ